MQLLCPGPLLLPHQRMLLRSEKNFADLRVVFLTGRGDPKAVQTLLALKPAGYLLKYLKPDEIKAKVDAFFEKWRTEG